MQASAEEGVPPELVAEPPLSAEQRPQAEAEAEPEPEPAASRSGWMRCETGGARSGRWSLLWLALSPGELVITAGATELARLPLGGLKARETNRPRKDAPFSFRLDVNDTLVGRSKMKYVLEPHPASDASKRKWIEALNVASDAPPPPWRRGWDALEYAQANKVGLTKAATVLRSSYLFKQGPKSTDPFMRRWFVLVRMCDDPLTGFLLYYSDATARKPKRIIPLPHNGCVCTALEAAPRVHTWGGQPTHMFKLQLRPEVVAAGVALRESYLFATEHAGSRAAWVTALNSAAETDTDTGQAAGAGTELECEDLAGLRKSAALSRGLPGTSSWAMIDQHDNQRADRNAITVPVSWPQLEGRLQGLSAMYRVLRPCAVYDTATARSATMNSGDMIDVFECRKPTGSTATVRTPLGWACVCDEMGEALMEPIADASAALRRVVVTIHAGHNLVGADLTGTSDPYCRVRLGTDEARTEVISATNNPVWEQSVAFTCPVNGDTRCAAHRDKLFVAVWDDDWGEDDFLGCVEIDLAMLCSSELYRPPLSKEELPTTAATRAIDLPAPWLGKTWLPLRGVERGLICITVAVASLEVHDSADACDWPTKWFSARKLKLSPDDASRVLERIRSQLPATSDSATDEFGYRVTAGERDWQESQEFAMATEELTLLKWNSLITCPDRLADMHVLAEVAAPGANREQVQAFTDRLRGVCCGGLRELLLSGLPTLRSCARHPALVAWCGSIPMSDMRKHLWLHLSHGAEARAGSKLGYQDFVDATAPGAEVADWLAHGQSAAAFQAGRALISDICRDIPRTSEDILPEEAEALTRILSCLALAFPNVGYTQGLNFIGLMLLRVLREEEVAFWSLAGLCNDLAPLYFVRSMAGVRADMHVLQRLLDAQLPRLASHFRAVGYTLDMCLANWFVPLFSNMSFPPYVVVRIWDWLFVDGVDVLLFITVALLTMLESKLLQCRDFGECHSLLTASDFQCMIPGRTMFQLLSDALDLHTGMGTRAKKWRVEAIHSVVSETENYNATAALRALAAQTDGISEDDVKTLYDKFKSLGIQARSGQADESLKLKTAAKGKEAVVFEARRLDRTGFKVVISELLPELTAQMNAQALEALFLAFDWDGDGEISFAEMLLTIGVLRGGSTDSRLQFCFQMCATEGRVAVADLTRLFKLCYTLFYPSLPREQLPCVVEALVATIVTTQHAQVSLNFDQFCAVARRHPFVLDCFSLTPDEQGSKLRLSLASGRMVDKAGWVELTRSQSDETWERRFISVRDSSALVFHAAEPHSHTSNRTEAAAEETLDIRSVRVREPTYARLYHPHSLRLALVAAGHERKVGVIDCGSAQEKLAWAMCFSCHGADVAADLLEAGKMLLMQRQQRATATSTPLGDTSDNANPSADSVTHAFAASARRRMRTSLFFKAGPLQLLSQGWITTWAVLSHELLIIYDSEAGSGAGIEHELKRCNLGDGVCSITFVPVGGGEDGRSSLISIVIGEGEASDVTRLSAGSEATGAEWCSSLRAQAHLDDEDD